MHRKNNLPGCVDFTPQPPRNGPTARCINVTLKCHFVDRGRSGSTSPGGPTRAALQNCAHNFSLLDHHSRAGAYHSQPLQNCYRRHEQGRYSTGDTRTSYTAPCTCDHALLSWGERWRVAITSHIRRGAKSSEPCTRRPRLLTLAATLVRHTHSLPTTQNPPSAKEPS